MILISFRSNSLCRTPAALPMKSDRPAVCQEIGCMESRAMIPTAVKNRVSTTSMIVIPFLLQSELNIGPSSETHGDHRRRVPVVSQGDGPVVLAQDPSRLKICLVRGEGGRRDPDVASMLGQGFRFVNGEKSVGRGCLDPAGIGRIGAVCNRVWPVLRLGPQLHIVD